MGEPVLKWAGGKRQILAEITAVFPVSFAHYHEPFVGGGAVFFRLQPEDGSINDINRRLIGFYRVVQQWPEEMIEENLTHEHTQEYFYEARAEFNDLRNLEDPTTEQSVREASLFLYLNRTCFNGLYRENSDGEFNVPFGSYDNPDWVQAERIKAAHVALVGTNIFNEDFEYVRDEVEEGDLVYFDPPYEPVSTTANFTDYHATGFDKGDQERLRDLTLDMHEAGVFVVVSNSPPVAELYEPLEGFTVEHVDAARSINSDGEARGDVGEILVTNVPVDERRRKTLSEFTN